jgi:CHAT domain-containing protein
LLSACDSGFGEVQSGEGVAGLGQEFQLAAAQSVVATLCQIPDAQTVTLLESFFSLLGRRSQQG